MTVHHERLSVEEIATGIYVYTRTYSRVAQNEGEVPFAYAVEAYSAERIRITLDFDGSTNLSLAGFPAGAAECTVELEAYQRVPVVRCVAADPRIPCGLKVSFTAFANPPPLPPLSSEPHQRPSGPPIGGLFALGDCAAGVAKQCEAKGTYFVDPEFPPCADSLGLAAPSTGGVVWRRPAEWVSTGNVRLFDEGFDAKDVMPGVRTWVHSAAAVLAERPDLVRRLFGVHDLNCGVYTVRLTIDGRPKEVLVDDFLPCSDLAEGSGPVFSRTHSESLWVSLLEKALAKQFGSYAALKSHVRLEHALGFLTGNPTLMHRLDRRTPRTVQLLETGELWRRVAKWVRSGQLVVGTVSRASGPTGSIAVQAGLRARHPYVVLRSVRATTGEHLLQLRNPWGVLRPSGSGAGTEQILQWLPGSTRWTPRLRAELGISEKDYVEDTSMLWVSWGEFVHLFCMLDVCLLHLPQGQMSARARAASVAARRARAAWWTWRHVGHFSLRSAALPLPNRDTTSHHVSDLSELLETCLFSFDVMRPSHVILTLSQSVERMAVGLQAFLDIALVVYRIPASENLEDLEAIFVADYSSEKNLVIELDLEPGAYFAIPLTTGPRLRDNLAAVCGTTTAADDRTEEPAGDKVPVYDLKKGRLSLRARRAVRRLFERFDADMDGVLCADELTRLHQLHDGCALSPVMKRWILDSFSTVKTGGGTGEVGLTPLGLLELYASLCAATADSAANILMHDLRKAGCDDDFRWLAPNDFVFCVHSTSRLDVHAADAPQELIQHARLTGVLKEGSCTKTYIADSQLCLFTKQEGYAGVGFAVENLTNHAVELELNCSKSENVVTTAENSHSLTTTMLIGPKELLPLCHLVPAVGGKGWSWGYSASWRFINVEG